MLETSLVVLYLLIGAVVGWYAAVAFVREASQDDDHFLLAAIGFAAIAIGIIVAFCWLPIVVGYVFATSVKDKN